MGNYPVDHTLQPIYNAFVNYSEDPNNSSKPFYGRLSGSITFTTVDTNYIIGSLDAQCQIVEGLGIVHIKGTFKAPKT